MTETVRVHNPNPFEVVIDLEGHALDGHSATDVSRDALTDHLIDSDLLIILHPAPVAVDEVAEAPTPAQLSKPKRRTSTEATGNGSETGE